MLETHTNRASALVERAAEIAGTVLPPSPDRPRFSYWCTFTDPDAAHEPGDVRLVDRSVSNQLESKANVARLLHDHDIDTDIDGVFAPTFLDVASAAAHPVPPAIWFVKPSHLSGGRGIDVIPHDSLATFDLPPHHLLQAGVENLLLLDGRKTTVRCHLLLWDGRAWMFDDGFALLHGVPYEHGSTDRRVQVDHQGYRTGTSGVEMRVLSDVAALDGTLAACRNALLRLLPALDDVLAETAADRYLLLGIDGLPTTDGVRLIEINAMPNFVHTAEVNERLNVPLFTAAMLQMLGTGSERFEALTGS